VSICSWPDKRGNRIGIHREAVVAPIFHHHHVKGGSLKKLITMLSLVVIMGSLGCGKKVAIHPGAISNLDSYSYDVLLTEQDVLIAAKADVLAGTLNAKDQVNTAIAQYNTTQGLWQVYHANGQGADALTQAVAALVTLLGDIQKMRGKATAPVPTSGLTWPTSMQPVYGGAL